MWSIVQGDCTQPWTVWQPNSCWRCLRVFFHIVSRALHISGVTERGRSDKTRRKWERRTGRTKTDFFGPIRMLLNNPLELQLKFGGGASSMFRKHVFGWKQHALWSGRFLGDPRTVNVRLGHMMHLSVGYMSACKYTQTHRFT